MEPSAHTGPRGQDRLVRQQRDHDHTGGSSGSGAPALPRGACLERGPGCSQRRVSGAPEGDLLGMLECRFPGPVPAVIPGTSRGRNLPFNKLLRLFSREGVENHSLRLQAAQGPGCLSNTSLEAQSDHPATPGSFCRVDHAGLYKPAFRTSLNAGFVWGNKRRQNYGEG